MLLQSHASTASLQDRWQRHVSYMRISLIEHCNYACTYCIPEDGWPKISAQELLSFNEIIEIITIMAGRGLKKVRFTGGEPLLRKGITELIAQVKRIPEIEQIALTTNGHLLVPNIEKLIQAGLTHLNISIDTFDDDEFKKVTRGGELDKIIEGIKTAQSYGMKNIKLNAVLTPDLIQDQSRWLHFCYQSWDLQCIPRFIEVMPMGNGLICETQTTNQQVVKHLHQLLSLAPWKTYGKHQGPAQYFQVTQGAYQNYRFGVINPMSDDGFCQTCNRVRLSATGQFRACLADDHMVDLRSPLRLGMHGPALLPFIESALYGKKIAHQMQRGHFPKTPMTHVGG